MLGMASPLVGIAAVNALLFTAYSNLKKLQEPYPGGPLTLGQIGIAGAGAGMDCQPNALHELAILSQMQAFQLTYGHYFPLSSSNIDKN